MGSVEFSLENASDEDVYPKHPLGKYLVAASGHPSVNLLGRFERGVWKDEKFLELNVSESGKCRSLGWF